jgi:hypothetical protein
MRGYSGGFKHKIKSRDGASRTNEGINFCIFFIGWDQYTIFFFFFFSELGGGTRAPPGPPLPPFLIKRKQNGHSQALK